MRPPDDEAGLKTGGYTRAGLNTGGYTRAGLNTGGYDPVCAPRRGRMKKRARPNTMARAATTLTSASVTCGHQAVVDACDHRMTL